MDLVLAWVWFPLVLLAGSAGWGLLAERAAGVRLPGELVVPLGFAAVVVVSQLLTLTDATAELALPVVVAGALAGLAVRRARIAPGRWPALAAIAVFAVLGAPVYLSGEPTFAGYAVLGDTAVHFLGVDHLMKEGQQVSGLASSSYSETVRAYYESAGYPSGAHTALGSLQPLSGLDVAWVFQPYLSFLGALTALCGYAMVTTLAGRDRALAAALGALPALYVGYVLIASVKEVATVLVVALLVALIGPLARERGLRPVLALALAAAAGMCVVSLAVAPWLGLVLLAAVWAVHRHGGWARVAKAAALFVVTTLALGLPALLAVPEFVEVVGAVTTAQVELGNLFAPLKVWQALPAWPAADLRFTPADGLAEWLVVASGVVLVAGLARLRAPLAWLYLAVSLVATLYVVRRGSPWADAKALMILSPAVALAAAAGALSWRPAAARWALIAVLVAGMGWSAAKLYHDAALAPRDRLSELERIGEDLEGPTLTTEFEEFAKHFLRRGAPVAPLEPYHAQPVGFSDAVIPPFGSALDLSHLDPAYVRSFETLVLRRDPLSPPPPDGFREAGGTEHYLIYERGEGDLPGCDPAPVVLDLTTAQLPAFWGDPQPSGSIGVFGSGELVLPFETQRSEDFRVWLGGSVGRPVELFVDGVAVGKVGGARNYSGTFEPVGHVFGLRPGVHELRIVRPGGDLSPGDGSGRRIGPVVLAREPYRCAS